MSRKQFWVIQAIISLICLAGLWLLSQTTIGQGFFGFSVICLLMFFGLSTALFELGIRAVESTNKNNFINVIMVSVFLKMILSLILLFIYTKTVRPQTSGFLLPFFATYLVYTITEVWALTKIGKAKPIK